MSLADFLLFVAGMLFLASFLLFLMGYAKAIALKEWGKQSELIRWGALCFVGAAVVGAIRMAAEGRPEAGGALVKVGFAIAVGWLFAKWWRRRGER